MPKDKNEKIDISKSLSKLEQIVNWFKEQEDVDVEIGLDKLKEAAPILKNLKSRLKTIENEFEEIKKEVDIEESDEASKELL